MSLHFSIKLNYLTFASIMICFGISFNTTTLILFIIPIKILVALQKTKKLINSIFKSTDTKCKIDMQSLNFII